MVRPHQSLRARVSRRFDRRRIIRNAVLSGQLLAALGTTLRDLEEAVLNLEPTYLIRLWAEFETAVRSYHSWLIDGTNLRIRTSDLIDTVAAVRRGRAISNDVRLQVHEVREYRNLLVHERDDPILQVRVVQARSCLNTYLAKSADSW